MLLPEVRSTLPNPRIIYRLYLQHLRLLRDPQVWKFFQPAFRKLLETPGPLVLPPSDGKPVDPVAAEATRKHRDKTRESRRIRALKNAQEEYRRLRAAVACHPHALARLLEEAYGQRGSGRWELLRKISGPWLPLHCNIVPTDPLPPPLCPLAPPAVADDGRSPRARTTVPQRIIDAAAKAKTERDWRLVKPPLIIPSSDTRIPVGDPPYSTPWQDLTERERQQVTVYNLRHLVGLRVDVGLAQREGDDSNDNTADSTGDSNRGGEDGHAGIPSGGLVPESKVHHNTTSNYVLDLSPLRPHMRRIFPQKLVNARISEPPFPKPRPALTRTNPHVWGHPHELTPRLLRRVYQRLWCDLKWVQPAGRPDLAAGAGFWKRCSYDQLIAWEMGDEDNANRGAEKKFGDRKKQATKKRAKVSEEGFKVMALPVEHRWDRARQEDLQWLDIDGEAGKNPGRGLITGDRRYTDSCEG